MPVGPTVHARALGDLLTQLREAKKIKQKDAAAEAEISQPKLSQVEAGVVPVRKSGQPPLSKGELLLLCQLYDVDDATRDRLEELRLGAGRPGWWYIYSLPELLNRYVGYEAGATSIRAVALTLVPGLFQTREYARKLHTMRSNFSPDEVDRRVAARMQRQERLAGDRPVQLTVVIDEAALLRCARDPDAATAQLLRIHEVAQLPNVTVQVLSLELGLHDGMGGSFTILGFPPGVLRDIVYQEHLGGGHIIDDHEVVQQRIKLFGELQVQALDPDRSSSRILELAAQPST